MSERRHMIEMIAFFGGIALVLVLVVAATVTKLAPGALVIRTCCHCKHVPSEH